jgi:hypothetical protein
MRWHFKPCVSSWFMLWELIGRGKTDYLPKPRAVRFIGHVGYISEPCASSGVMPLIADRMCQEPILAKTESHEVNWTRRLYM